MKRQFFISIFLSIIVNILLILFANYCFAESFQIQPANYESQATFYDIDIIIGDLPLEIRKRHFILIDSNGNKKYFAVSGKEKKYTIVALKTGIRYILVEIIYTEDKKEILNNSAKCFFSLANIIFFKKTFYLVEDTPEDQEPEEKKVRKIPI